MYLTAPQPCISFCSSNTGFRGVIYYTGIFPFSICGCENQFSRSAQSVNYNLNWTFNQTSVMPYKKEMTPESGKRIPLFALSISGPADLKVFSAWPNYRLYWRMIRASLRMQAKKIEIFYTKDKQLVNVVYSTVGANEKACLKKIPMVLRNQNNKILMNLSSLLRTPNIATE